MSNENKKTPAEGTGVSGMLATASLAVAESDVKSFLENILAAGNHALVTKQGSGMRHEWSQTADGLIKLIDLRTDNWFSPAAFSGTSRKAKDCTGARALWLDIDIGAHHSKPDYTDPKQFAADYKSFMQGTGLPAPWIISTGHGAHLYWVLESDIAPDQWSDYMARLFAACDKFGLKYDHAATDISRILRMPGTYNYKGSPVPVKIMKRGVADSGALVTALSKFEPVKQTTVRQEDSVRELRETEPVLAGCEQIRTCGSAKYPTWRNAARCLTFCKDGFETFHQLSQDDDRYDADQCTKTWDSLDKNNYAPVKCDTFAQGERGEVCARCPNRGRITTPVMLGKKLKAKVEPAPADSIRGVPFESDLYSVVPGKGVQWTFKNKEGAEVTLTIAPFEFYIMELVIDNRMLTPLRTYKARVVFSDNSYRDFDLVIDEIYKTGLAPIRILTQYGIAPEPRFEKQMVEFMRTYISKVQNELTPSYVRDHYGWYEVQDLNGEHHSEFVVGAQTYTASGVKVTYLDSRAQAMAEHKMTVRGTLDEWKKIPRLYRELDQKSAQLLMCASFGSVFMPLGIGTATNVMYNFYDTVGGKGKSSLLSALASVWGDPSSLPLGRTDTIAAKYQQYSVYHNLPILIDEITGMCAEDMAGMLYDLVNGREKNRSNRAGTELQRGGSWQTITVSTSNQSVYEMLKTFREQTLATSMRVIEMRCDFKDFTGNVEVTHKIDSVMTAVHGNYGLAGREFIQYIISHPEVRKYVTDSVAAFSQKYRRNNDERFWVTGLGVALAAGRLAVQMGLLDYDIDALEDWIGKVLLPDMRSSVKDSRQSPVSIMADFVTDNINNTLAVQSHTRQAPEPGLTGMPDPYVVIEPRGSLQIRRELDTNTVIFKRSALARWAESHGISAATLLDDLRQYPNADISDVRQDLGQGVLRYSSARQRCISVRLDALSARMPTPNEQKYSAPDMAKGEGEGECPF